MDAFIICGTFALYSLICRSAKVGLIPNDQPEDHQLSNYRLDTPSNQLRRAQMIKEKMESSKTIKIILFLITILGTSMVIGDGVLTPCISVLSAVSGIKSLGKDAVVGISIAILIVLFSVQRLGTDKVGFAFAPVILLWFSFIGLIGLYNLFKYEIGVLRAFNPKYMIDYFKRNGKQGWISLGGIVLCITGTEAMFADLGHFNVRAIQISFSSIVFPALLAAYSGQAAYLTKYNDDVSDTFYKSIPDPLYWPTFVVAVAAAIIASQAMISGAFAIISQSLSLGCFPRVKVVHTSAKYEGQVYIPEVNYLLMVACVVVCFAFKTTEKIGNAYGIAVVAVMVITTCLVTLIMLVIWKTRIWWIALFFFGFGAIEAVYLSSVLYKFKQGGFLPLAFSLFLMISMGIWHYVQRERYIYELQNKVSSEYVRDLAERTDINRLPGIGLLYSELVQGIPPIFPHFISNIPSTHSVIVFVSIKSIPISKVALEERFLFRQVEPREYRMFRCIVRYGYKDATEEPHEFERQLVENLKEFIRHEHFIREGGNNESAPEEDNIQHSTILAVKDGKTKESPAVHVEDNNESAPEEDSIQHSTLLAVKDGKSKESPAVHVEESPQQTNQPRISSVSIQSINASSRSTQSVNGIKSANSSGGMIHAAVPKGAEEEMQFVQKAMEKGVIYLIGEAEVVAKPESSWFKKLVVDYGYSFLRKNFRQGKTVLAIPRTRLLRVGMTYEV
ncbi:PREDICTED: potassium transporter 5-like [Populus euphratica]|uniref:Potassium transporter n=1 Tax=Populus euphratica TaxID=75702 RepID=A0AAJ6XYR5_POPEU|nr:PREDICTED: potassium transporter 5-like [Populus euphratica]